MDFVAKIKLIFRLKWWAKFRINHFPSYYSSHSQFGEDMILNSIFHNKKDGFYVDIGAHHPVYYSNTYHFYLKGWKGINIDAAPGSMELFKILRKRDINVEACIAPVSGQEVDFYTFDQAALNTFDKEMAKKAESNAKLLQIHNLTTLTLEDCLTKALSPNQEIDFLSIDVEGLDEMILKTNNWEKFSPKIIVFESHQSKLEDCYQESIVLYLNSLNYEIIAKCGPSLIARLKH